MVPSQSGELLKGPGLSLVQECQRDSVGGRLSTDLEHGRKSKAKNSAASKETGT